MPGINYNSAVTRLQGAGVNPLSVAFLFYFQYPSSVENLVFPKITAFPMIVGLRVVVSCLAGKFLGDGLTGLVGRVSA